MSFQITILKVLAGHPGGRASLADLRRAVAILISSGSDWTNWTKRLAACAPGLDIFGQALVLRDDSGWQITEAGRALLASVEKPAMSFQITILKVLAGHPGGRASLADLRRAVAILISSGSDWTNRTKRLAACAPGLDIFGQALVLRDDSGWQITEAGRALLRSVEKPAPVMATSDHRTHSRHRAMSVLWHETDMPTALSDVRSWG
jgi:hypothetical protein